MERKEILEKMTLREKVDFLTGKAFFKTRDYPQYGIRSTYLSDGPHGLRKQAKEADHLGLHESVPATCFPTASLAACSWDEALGERVGKALGEEAAAMGVDMILGPGLNIKRNPLCGRNFEYFSEDPLLAGKMAAAYARGIQSRNVNACLKHFAANNREYRRMTANSVVDERTLRELYLTGFEIAVKEGGAAAVMTSYNRINGIYANEHPHVLGEILRQEWGFNGLVVTDWGGSNSRVEGLRAGSDLEMPPCRYGADDLLKAVETGEISEQLVDRSVCRMLDRIDFAAKKSSAPFNAEAHHALARECAAKSIVLLENDGVLPLKGSEKVAVVGDFAFKPRYQGAGSSVVNPTKLSVAVDTLKASLPVVAAERGYRRFGKKKKGWVKRTLKAVAGADVVLFFAGLDECSEAEGIDRAHIRIPENQKVLFNALTAAGKSVVVILACGSVVETDWATGASAVLYVGLAGQAGAEAIADILTGRVNPSGKLAESWVRRYEDGPTATKEAFPGGRDDTAYREGLFVGYRYFASAGVKPKYPFGYGKSYTSFGYSAIRASQSGVSFTVTNTGGVAGDEIAQVYIAKKDSVIIRPAIELKGFARVHLEAGESKEITVPLNDRSFAYFDAMENGWRIEAGEYEIKVAASSEDVRLTAVVSVAGIVPENQLEKYPAYAAKDVKHIPDEEFSALLGFVPEAEHTPKRRQIVHENSTVEDLKYARGFAGRLFSRAVRFWGCCYRAFGRREKANTIVMGALHQPVRGLAKFGGFSRTRMEGLLAMFNGHFFRGLKLFFKREKKGKKVKKQ